MNTWPLGYSITRLESQNRKFAPILIITGPKNDHFFVCKQTGFVNQRLWDFAKMILFRVSIHWLWLESSHSVKNATRVESLSFSRWLESSQSHQKSWLESSHWLESRCHCLLGPALIAVYDTEIAFAKIKFAYFCALTSAKFPRILSKFKHLQMWDSMDIIAKLFTCVCWIDDLK